MTREYIEQSDGTLWLCTQTTNPYGRDMTGREYWVFYCNGPLTMSNAFGFYARSIDDARAKLQA